MTRKKEEKEKRWSKGKQKQRRMESKSRWKKKVGKKKMDKRTTAQMNKWINNNLHIHYNSLSSWLTKRPNAAVVFFIKFLTYTAIFFHLFSRSVSFFSASYYFTYLLYNFLFCFKYNIYLTNFNCLIIFFAPNQTVGWWSQLSSLS